MQLVFKFEASNNKEYKVNSNWISMVYTQESTTSRLVELYYLVLKLSWEKEYLGACISNLVSSKAHYLLLQR